MNVEKQIEEAIARSNALIDAKCELLMAEINNHIKEFEKQYTRAINTINFKAVLAEQVGWDGFQMLGDDSGVVLMAEIL